MAGKRPLRSQDLVPTTDLNPQLREAIRLYTDPLLPTFGNKASSCRAAGYDQNHALDTVAAQREIQRIETMRAEQGSKVADYMGTYAFDAARELVHQLRMGVEVQVQSVEDLLRERTDKEVAVLLADALATASADSRVSVSDIAAALEGNRIARADQITKSNRVAVQAAKQRLTAVELLLRYHLGHPEQRIKHSHEKHLPDELDLNTLTDSDLQMLGEVIADVLEKKRGAAPKDDTPSAPVVEADWTED